MYQQTLDNTAVYDYTVSDEFTRRSGTHLLGRHHSLMRILCYSLLV